MLGYATWNLIRGAAAAAKNGAQGQQTPAHRGNDPVETVGAVGHRSARGGRRRQSAWCRSSEAGRRNFDQQFQPFALSAGQRKWIDRIGRFGTAARGVVFALIGVFLFQAAYFHDPKRAQGIDGVLASLLHQPYGIWLLGVVALGLIAFAVYSALSGLWLRFPRPA